MSDRLNGGNEGFLYTANDEYPLKWESLGKERGGRGEQSDRAEGGGGGEERRWWLGARRECFISCLILCKHKGVVQHFRRDGLRTGSFFPILDSHAQPYTSPFGLQKFYKDTCKKTGS